MTESSSGPTSNVDRATVDHFGEEWSSFTQSEGWSDAGLDKAFARYFATLPSGALNPNAVVGDFGAGSGRWAKKVAPLVKQLYVLEPSRAAMAVAHRALAEFDNVTYLMEPIGAEMMPAHQLDVAYSIGVIHHIPDPKRAVEDVLSTLKPGGVFLGYLYYALDNRPFWFRLIWRASNEVRLFVSRLPANRKQWVTDAVAALVYWPLARVSRLVSKFRISVTQIPLSEYSDKSFYVMRNDALDRLGTPLEQRFTRSQITEMLANAGFDISTLLFSDDAPFWCFSVQAPRNSK